MAKLLYTILIICIVVQLMFALCDALDLDDMVGKTKETLSDAGDAITEAAKDVVDKVKDARK